MQIISSQGMPSIVFSEWTIYIFRHIHILIYSLVIPLQQQMCLVITAKKLAH